MTKQARSDNLALVTRASRLAALQVSLALTVVLLVVGTVVYLVDARLQDQQITARLQSIAHSLDDVDDPPADTVVGMYASDGVEASAHRAEVARLLAGPSGLFRVDVGGEHYQALVTDVDRRRVVVMISMHSYQAGRTRLLGSLAVAAGVGVLISLLVVTVLTRRMIRPLTQALEVQRRFVADASHELRAPLTVLYTRAQLLARRAESHGDEQLATQATDLVDDARALSDIIDDLLESASTGAATARKDSVDLMEVATSVQQRMRELAESAGVDLEVVTPHPADAMIVRGSASALRRALVALVDNALSHGRPGGTVLLRLSRSSRRVEVAVVDDGSGVEPEFTESLFDRFARGDETLTEDARRRSYGIGLALVREIASAHGGDIRYTETPGGGATFTLRLPAAD